ncbi:uncharacterized protein FFUJ_10460 [Fusarium fujikuroi IMI 58289]|uniref:Uncharacterized protein n=1 Tax=Gibberella fujikuroi (strain CBS 195.34 / IMI 58289 / NRRL A-6831) TaxID=1279085 RepID=S0EHB5_GIBF5|nr:uncharacterized protein FFUJ_10460 [Fusarium fujikuroi IMI 58289]CCT74411.1 uncharacterized protein FFUJ_10460 [Fusarium fujikuroi IMI 58289]SCO26165.1 uncharacterized protein FFM5_14459 [Fusarium fujikuroi]SCO58281.1 uncharacterized protein FFMR_15437 [Fusarium fujikuroi]
MHATQTRDFNTWLCLVEVRTKDIHGTLNNLRQGPPRPLSEEEISRLMFILGHVFHATEMAQKLVDEHDEDQKRDLQAVCQEAKEFMIAVDCMQIAIWRLNPDRLCLSHKGRVRYNPYEEPIDKRRDSNWWYI